MEPPYLARGYVAIWYSRLSYTDCRTGKYQC